MEITDVHAIQTRDSGYTVDLEDIIPEFREEEMADIGHVPGRARRIILHWWRSISWVFKKINRRVVWSLQALEMSHPSIGNQK